MSKSNKTKQLQEALGHAIRIIESYQFDIQHSQWTGIDLVGIGFCQGEVYRNALADIRGKTGVSNGSTEKQNPVG